MNKSKNTFLKSKMNKDVDARILPNNEYRNAVNVQVKVKRKLPDGTKVEVDLKKMISLIEEADYQGYVVLEYEEEAPREKVPEYIDLLKKIINPS